jgi:hypothetical protein
MRKLVMSLRWKPVLMVLLFVTAGWMPVAAQETDVMEQRFDFVFNGGTVEQFVNQVNQVMPDMNMIAQEHTNEILVPEFQVKHVSGYELAKLLGRLVEVNFSQVGPNIVVLEGPNRRRVVPVSTKPKVHLFVYPLMPLIQDRSSQDVILLINQACEMMQVPPPAFRIHEETLMLMASVTSEQLAIIEQVIDALVSEPKIGDLQKLEEELSSVKAERDALKNELAVAVKASKSSK